MVDRARERLPTERRIHTVQRGREATHIDAIDKTGRIVSIRIGGPEVDIGRLREVLVSAKVPHIAQVASLARLEQILARVSTEHLAGGLEEDPRVRDEARDGNTGVVDAVFAADKILYDEGPIGPWEDMVVQTVDLAERRAHLAHLRQESAGEFGEGEESLLEVDALLTERDEKIRARVRIDDRLKRRLRFVHLKGRIWIDLVPAGGAQEVANHSHVGIEHFGPAYRRTRCAVDGQCPARTTRAARAGGCLSGGRRRRRWRRGWTPLRSLNRREPGFERR